MTMMDERVAERRRGVSEDRARRRLKWILGAIVLVLVVGGAVWLVRSPVLSIDAVEVSGHSMSDPAAYVDDLGMGIGVPTIDVRSGEIKTAIEADPWVANAVVEVSWPGSISVAVTEHVPVALVEAPDGWYLASAEGALIADAGSEADLPKVSIAADGFGVGDTVTDDMILGALTFLQALPAEDRVSYVLSVREDSLFAVVNGHDVRLGRPTQVAAKAVVLVELLDTGLAEGASIDLIAPMRPAVRNPQPEVEIEE